MKEKDKELLLKDLCARLPYGIKCRVVKRSIDGEMLFIRNGLELTVDNVKGLVTNNMYEIKPYLFPLSNMTEEQKEEYESLCIKETSECTDLYGIIFTKDYYYDTVESIDYLYKNHIDIRGFIEKGLANDATGLNIY